MTRKTPDWLHERREFCEERFSFLIEEFGYHRSLRRFRWGGFQLGYLGPGAGVLVEWYPRDEVMVWLLPMNPGEALVGWGGPGGPKGFDLAWVAAAAGGRLENDKRDMRSPTNEVIAVLAGRLRSSGQGMLRGDYSQVPAIRDLIRAQVERLQRSHPRPPLYHS